MHLWHIRYQKNWGKPLLHFSSVDSKVKDLCNYKMNKLIPILSLISSLLSFAAFASIDKDLPIYATPAEKRMYQSYLSHPHRELVTNAPVGPIHSLGEWEEADAVLTLWNNTSLLKALSENGNVKILADSNYDKQSWMSRIKSSNLDESRFSFYIVETDSIWIRDYGPWWIVDGQGQFGIVDTVYNRPRPSDDIVPDFIGKELGVPVYKPGLVHTGGNYYSDGLGNGYSSTLPFKENSKFTLDAIVNKMLEFLGIEKYTTSPLGEQITIEHLDTFGKLVTPDTWVFSEFDKKSKFYNDAENMVALIKKSLSPYGTPYKIHRLKMVSLRDDLRNDQRDGGYRAYLNSFISNGVLYFAAYGDEDDDVVKQIYQKALPGYKIIGVSAQGTEWGDSVHCRTRNLIKKDTVFIFPKITVPATESDSLTVSADIIPSPNEQITSAEVVFVVNGIETERLPMTNDVGHKFKLVKSHFPKNTKVEYFISAKDSSGKTRTHPMIAPKILMSFTL